MVIMRPFVSLPMSPGHPHASGLGALLPLPPAPERRGPAGYSSRGKSVGAGERGVGMAAEAQEEDTGTLKAGAGREGGQGLSRS